MEKIFDLSSPLYERLDLFYILETEMGEIFTDDYLRTLYKMVEDYNKTTKLCGKYFIPRSIKKSVYSF